jgi:SAM-dependent methyltransferase
MAGEGARERRTSGVPLDGESAIAYNRMMASEDDWSFTPQWADFNRRAPVKTWSWTLVDRTAMFLREVEMEPADLARLRVLDAGCGNGRLTNEIGQWAREVVGLDRSTSVVTADSSNTRANVSFVQGDLNDPPLAAESFDLVYSSGVVHHNRSTAESFAAVARLVKPGGQFYCFVYRPGTTPIPWLTIAVNEPIRHVVSRLPLPLRKIAVRAHALAYHTVLSVVRPGKYTFDDHMLAAFDAITPRYAHRHWPHDMARWFHDAGFDNPRLTHWDNGGGFGMIARRFSGRAPQTPGPRFKAGQ